MKKNNFHEGDVISTVIRGDESKHPIVFSILHTRKGIFSSAHFLSEETWIHLTMRKLCEHLRLPFFQPVKQKMVKLKKGRV